jgi:coproporphyrinogen III oxidase-like Fe-S oxidoreductase
VTRTELRLFIPKDDSRISRSIADLTAQGYITNNDKKLSLTPSGLALVTDFLAHYFSKVDALHRYAEAIHSCANATSLTPSNQL